MQRASGRPRHGRAQAVRCADPSQAVPDPGGGRLRGASAIRRRAGRFGRRAPPPSAVQEQGAASVATPALTAASRVGIRAQVAGRPLPPPRSASDSPRPAASHPRRTGVYDVHDDSLRHARQKLRGRPIRGAAKAATWVVLQAAARRWLDAFVCASASLAQRFPEQRTVVAGNFPLLEEFVSEPPPARANPR